MSDQTNAVHSMETKDHHSFKFKTFSFINFYCKLIFFDKNFNISQLLFFTPLKTPPLRPHPLYMQFIQPSSNLNILHANDR